MRQTERPRIDAGGGGAAIAVAVVVRVLVWVAEVAATVVATAKSLHVVMLIAMRRVGAKSRVSGRGQDGLDVLQWRLLKTQKRV